MYEEPMDYNDYNYFIEEWEDEICNNDIADVETVSIEIDQSMLM